MSQIVTLVTLISKKFEYNHDTVRLHTLGPYSKITDITDGPSSNADLHLKEGGDQYFTIGLTWLLNYLLHLAVHICTKLNETSEEISAFRYTLYFMCRIIEHEIGGASIKYDPGRMEEWTEACNNLLKFLKWMINQCSKLSIKKCQEVLQQEINTYNSTAFG